MSILRVRILFLTVFLSLAGRIYGAVEVCTQLHGEFANQKQNKFSQTTGLVPRYVDSSGSDSKTCLNYDNVTQPPPCQTLEYALNGDNATADNVAIYLGPGTHVLYNATAVINSQRVAIIGAGEEFTFVHCGTYLEDDTVCEFKNFQVRNSTFVYISGITFTRCGPITSNVYIAFSNHVYIENCSFR